MTLKIDRTVDAAYVTISELPVDHTVRLDANRLVDYAEDGTVVGIEFLSVSRGVNLQGLPEQRELARLFDGRELRRAVG
jgi:uncharacterized protein YuzE